MKARAKETGHSVLELLFAMMLFLMISGVLFKLFHVMTTWRDTSVRQMEKQAGNLVVVAKLAALLEEMPEVGFSASYSSGNPVNGDLALCGITSRDSAGLWSEQEMVPDDHFYQLLYLHKASGELRSIHVVPSTSVPLTQPLLPANFTTPLGQAPDRVLGRDIEKFLLVDPLSGTLIDKPTSPLLLRVVQQGGESESSRTVERSIRLVR